MRKIVLMIFAILILEGCSKTQEVLPLISSTAAENSVKSNSEIKKTSADMKLLLVEYYGFLPETIQETDNGFIVEGDVVFSKSDFWERYLPSSNSSTRQYKAPNKVSLKTVSVNFDTAPIDWATAFRAALSKWNGLNLGVKFVEVKGFCPANGITVLYSSLGSGTGNIAAQTVGFPTSAGNPATYITVNSSCTGSQNSAQKLKTAVHELGHSIGFMHTDIASGATQIMTNLANCDKATDSNSIMNQGLMSFSDFSTCDKIGFKVIYP